MLSQRNKFVHKKIGEVQKYTKYSDVMKTGSKKNTLINVFITIACILLIGYCGKFILQAAHSVAGAIGKGTVSAVSKTIGKEMVKDEYGNVNVLIVGYGGQKHAGGYLADSMIVASWNPKLGAVTMISTPRDLFVYNKEEQVLGRINEVFSRGVGRKHEFDTGAKALIGQLEQIMGLKIPYYTLVDFQGFESLIDSVGGIQVDVPKPIYDPTYPDWNRGYLTFRVNSGLQTMSGEMALMYARSRHSTSDFDRSQRQQQIVRSVIERIIDQGMKPSKIKNLYSEYTKIIQTNISMDEMIGLGQYAYDLKHIFSYGFTTECSDRAWKFSHPGCFLYAPPRELFGGAAVMLPVGADNTNPTFYEYTKNFAFYVAHNQEYLIEKPNLILWSAIDKKYAKQYKAKTDGYAKQLAVKLNKYAFTINDVATAPILNSGTILYILGTGNYDNSINILKSFAPINQVIDINQDTSIQTGLLLQLQAQQMSGADIVLMLGNQYVDTLVNKKFDYYK